MTTPDDGPLRALVLCCTLKSGPEESSSELLGRQFLSALAEHDVEGELVRVVDHGVRFGVTLDEGDGDGWPALRERLMDSHILVVATPIWLGKPSSVCQMVLERLDAELAETDEEGRLLTFGRVGAVAVVGNEDGAHHVTAEVLQALSDTGFSLAANGATYWVGEARGSVDYKDLDGSEDTASTTRTAAANTAHLARLLRGAPYPPS